MTKSKGLIFSGYGLNCEEETQYAFQIAGGKADIIHINDLIDNKKILDRYQILAFPGGFSYGDDTGSGNAFAHKLKNHLWEKLKKFIEKDKLIIGICNGFQILINLGLLPGLKKQYGKRQAALIDNDSAQYTVRWVDLKIENNSPWLKKINSISLPIAHGQGKFYGSKSVLSQLKKQNLVAASYIKGEICQYQSLDSNPNGSLENIAAITDPTKKILGMMPHPERAIFFTQLPHWTYLKEKLERQGKPIPKNGPGLQIFQNGINYFK